MPRFFFRNKNDKECHNFKEVVFISKISKTCILAN